VVMVVKAMEISMGTGMVIVIGKVFGSGDCHRDRQEGSGAISERSTGESW